MEVIDLKMMNYFILLSTLIAFPLTHASNAISLSDDSIDFGEVLIGDEESEYIEIINNSSLIVEVEDVDLWGDSFIFDYSESCEGELMPNESCDIEIIFSPTDLDSFDAELVIRTNEDSYSVDIYGEGYLDD